jgi:hypothetical protein
MKGKQIYANYHLIFELLKVYIFYGMASTKDDAGATDMLIVKLFVG